MNCIYDTKAMVNVCQWHHNIIIGTQVDVLDSFTRWCIGTIVDIRIHDNIDDTNTMNTTVDMTYAVAHGQVTCLIHFDACDTRWDEWIPLLSSRLSPSGIPCLNGWDGWSMS
jgi:hypothetical protein